MANKGKLSEQEQDEMKALQDLRKGAGSESGKGIQFTDSQRIRLSELQGKASAGESKAEESSSKTTTSTGAFGTAAKK